MMNDDKRRHGQLGALYLIALILAICALGGFAMDTNHVFEVKSELQNATDAGALAGAAHLWFDIQNAESDAYKFTSKNSADGRAVSNGSPGTHVSVSVVPPSLTTHGRVTVTASMRISHVFSRLFNHYDDEITVHSTAGTAGQMWRLAANQAFPLAVSLDAVPTAKDFVGAALNSKSLGDEFSIYLGSQGAKNGTFTSLSIKPANAAYIKDAIDQALGLAKPIDGFIPSIKVDDDIFLDNGLLGQQALAKDPYKTVLASGPVLILPVIQGSGPYNQTRPVIGFIGFKVKSIKLHQGAGQLELITGTLVAAQALGETGPYLTDGTRPNAAMSRLSLGPIQLID